MQNGEMHSHYLYFQIDFLTSISSVRHCLSAKNGKSPGLLESHAHPPKNHQAGAQVKKKKRVQSYQPQRGTTPHLRRWQVLARM